MLVYGLTGGVGMGKSTAAGFLAEMGIPVVDTDAIAREVVEPGSEGLDMVVAHFGSAVRKADGSLDRGRLAEMVFGNATRRRELEEILHPRIRAGWQLILEKWQGEGCPQAVVVIPLLFETGADALVSRSICVACTEHTQLQRLSERGWREAQAANRIQAQWPVGQKMDRSDYVVWSEGRREALRMQLSRIVRQHVRSS